MTTQLILYKTRYTPASFQKKLRCPSQMLLETSTFYHTFTSFHSGWARCTIFQINTNLLVIYGKFNIFTKETYPSFISKKKKISALYRKRFSKHPLFTTFSIFLKVSEVCNISSKCWLPNKGLGKPVKYSVKHQCLTNVWLVFLSLKIDVWRCLMRKSCLMKVYFKINFSSNIFEFDQTIFRVCIVFHYFIKQVKKKQSIESQFERFTS